MTKKIEFANSLRGIAALLVVIAHLFILFWYQQDIAINFTGVPPYQGAVPIASEILEPFKMLYGFTGVGIFFLISGFVIPFALDKKSIFEFLIGRIFRIWPTYIVTTLFSLLCLYISKQYFHNDFFPLIKNIISSLLLTTDLSRLQPVDGVIWTLEIEIKFYLLMALIYKLVNKNPLLLITCAAIFTILVVRKNIRLNDDFAYFTYMFIGVAFNFLHKNKLSNKKFIGMLFTLFVCFIMQLRFEKQALMCYGLALIIFTTLYYARDKIKYPKILSYLADISYPLYVSHAIFSYVFLRIFLTIFDSPNIALMICIICVLINAYLLHVIIEVPANKLGKSFISYKLRSPKAIDKHFAGSNIS
jgi:peptidoglycan/LPS O-acetylase OafA/YrhL